MNIAFDAKRITHNRTGLGNYSRFLVKALAEYSPENNYLLLSPSVGQRELYADLLEYRSLSLRTPRSPLGKPFSSLWRNWGIGHSLSEHKIDLYHGLSNELPIGLYKSRRVGTVVTIHDLAFVRCPEFYKPADRLLYRFKYGASARNADHVIAISHATKRDVVEIFGVPEERISVVYQGCATRYAHIAPEAEAEARRQYGLSGRYLLFVGSIEERKNLKLVVQALSLLEDREISLVAVGKRTPYCAIVEAEARRLGVRSRVQLLHGVSDNMLSGLYRGAEVFVYPSRLEGFGIPLIEALQAGTPVIGATGSCLEEAAGPDSLYTDPDDADMLASMISQLLASEELRDRLVSRGQLYIQRFSPKTIARELRGIYERVLLERD